MASHGGGGNMSHLKITMVAVDKDKNSVHAFRWATTHIENPIVIAVHVKHRDISNQGKNVHPPDEDDLVNVFNPLREVCHPKVLKMKEAVIDDSDVVRGILEYAERNRIDTIVVGAPAGNKQNVLAKTILSKTGSIRSKKYKDPDVPSTIMKTAPDCCSVYVISKEKIVSSRPATGPMAPKNSQALPPSNDSEDGSVRSATSRGWGSNKGGSLKIEYARRESIEINDSPYRVGQKSTSSDGSDFSSFSTDKTKHDLDSSFATTDSQSSGGSSRSRQDRSDVEAEMRRLRSKLKQTMDMYSKACKDAVAAQSKANEINQWKLEEARKAEEARLAEEAARAMAEQEKAKAKAAMEAAEEAMRIAEKEANRRLHYEMKAKREAEEKDRALNALALKETRYRRYSIEDIEIATDKFSPTMKIGEGGYGPVFKGQLDHTKVAIKILSPDASQGRRQFQQEVEVLCNIRHPHMVLLLGACPEYGCLVYEYMDNGSLEDRLMRKQNTPPIPWRKRFEIAAEIATALLFLHQTRPEPLVHRDLKPANILLDRNYVSKISDVGLARLVPPSIADSVTQYHLTSAAGTFCYIDPEYQQTGKLTTKSDIYSLGIMLLQIITSKPPMGLTHLVNRSIEKDSFQEMLDPEVSDWPVEEALAFAKLALRCSELSKKDRPDLASEIVPELNRLRDFGYGVKPYV